MSLTKLRVIGVGLFFVVIFLSGVWLSRSGKPFNSMVLNLHKLIALAAGIFLVMIIRQIHQVDKLSPTGLIAAVVTGLLFLVTGISGGLLSMGKLMPEVIIIMHQILPVLAVFSTAVTLYLLGQ
jgi:ABC-type multidrug transport system permease subunit